MSAFSASASAGNGCSDEKDAVTWRVPAGLRNAKGSIIKTIAMMAKPTSISLAGGIPHPATFPFASFDVNLADGSPPLVLKNRAVTGGRSEEDGDADLHLNYQTGYGDQELRKVLIQHMKDYHAPKYDGWSLVPTTGSTDAITKCFQLLRPETGPAIVLSESLVWAAVLSIAEPLGYEVRGVDMDGDGIRTDALEATLEQMTKDGQRAAFLYTTPHGQNPTGSSLSMERKQQLYDLCQRYDLVIVEDDPYRFLSLPGDVDEVRPEAMPGVSGLPPSLLSFDTDGRVIHLESLSKWICPGLRVGWVTGPKKFVEGPYRLWTELTVQFACTVSQATLREMLVRWGHDGFENHLRHLQVHYAKQRKAMIRASEKHLSGMAEWVVPKAGMFVWFKINHLKGKGRAEAQALFEELAAEDVFMVPGFSFDATGGKEQPALRATYATALPDQIEEGIARLGRVLARHNASS